MGDRGPGRCPLALGDRLAVPRNDLRGRHDLAGLGDVLDAPARGAGATARTAAGRPRAPQDAPAPLPPDADRRCRHRWERRAGGARGGASGGRGPAHPRGAPPTPRTPDSPSWGTRDYSTAVADVTAPVQMIGGWYDIFLPWLIEDFSALRAAG